MLMETALCKMEVLEPIYPLEIVRDMRDQRGMLVQTPVSCGVSLSLSLPLPLSLPPSLILSLPLSLSLSFSVWSQYVIDSQFTLHLAGHYIRSTSELLIIATSSLSLFLSLLSSEKSSHPPSFSDCFPNQWTTVLPNAHTTVEQSADGAHHKDMRESAWLVSSSRVYGLPGIRQLINCFHFLMERLEQ